MTKKKEGVTPPPQKPPAEPKDVKAILRSMGGRPLFEFEHRRERGGYFLVGYAGLSVLVILLEFYESDRDEISATEVFVPLFGGEARVAELRAELAPA